MNDNEIHFPKGIIKRVKYARDFLGFVGVVSHKKRFTTRIIKLEKAHSSKEFSFSLQKLINLKNKANIQKQFHILFCTVMQSQSLIPSSIFPFLPFSFFVTPHTIPLLPV